jgi:hypothetical protein
LKILFIFNKYRGPSRKQVYPQDFKDDFEDDVLEEYGKSNCTDSLANEGDKTNIRVWEYKTFLTSISMVVSWWNW